MIHLADVSGVQLILIELGVLLQIVAMCAYIGGTTVYRRIAHPKEHGEHVQEQGLDSGGSELPAPSLSRRTRDESADENPHNELKASHLRRTSKVKFRQSFQFRRHGT